MCVFGNIVTMCFLYIKVGFPHWTEIIENLIGWQGKVARNKLQEIRAVLYRKNSRTGLLHVSCDTFLALSHGEISFMKQILWD